METSSPPEAAFGPLWRRLLYRFIAYNIALFVGLAALCGLAGVGGGSSSAVARGPFAIMGVALILLPLAFFLSAPWGVPIVTLLHRRSVASSYAYGLAGALCAVLTLLPLAYLRPPWSPNSESVDSLLLVGAFAAAGTISGCVYWLATVPARRRSMQRRA